MRVSSLHRKQCEQVGELFVACSGCGVLRNGRTSQFGSESVMTGGPRGDTPRATIQRPCCPAVRGSRNGSVPASVWQELDEVNVEDAFSEGSRC